MKSKTEPELKQYYAENADFHRYVDKCRKMDGRSVDEELRLKTVQHAAEYYQEKQGGSK